MDPGDHGQESHSETEDQICFQPGGRWNGRTAGMLGRGDSFSLYDRGNRRGPECIPGKNKTRLQEIPLAFALIWHRKWNTGFLPGIFTFGPFILKTMPLRSGLPKGAGILFVSKRNRHRTAASRGY